MQYSHACYKPDKSDEYQHNVDKTMTTVIDTTICHTCGDHFARMGHTPVFKTPNQLIENHDTRCFACTWASINK